MALIDDVKDEENHNSESGPGQPEEESSDWSSEDESPVSPLEPTATAVDVEQAWQPLAEEGQSPTSGAADRGENVLTPSLQPGGVSTNGGGREIGIADLSNMTVEELGRRLAAGDTLAVTGEQLLSYQPGVNKVEEESMTPEEEEAEERKIAAQEAAIREGNARDEERRRAPIPVEKSEAIVNAMKGFQLNGYKPQWAANVPDKELVARVKQRRSTER